MITALLESIVHTAVETSSFRTDLESAILPQSGKNENHPQCRWSFISFTLNKKRIAAKPLHAYQGINW
jgi:hypothetical protein